MARKRQLVLEDVTIIWPNFRGAATQWNEPGNRYFNIAFEPGELTDSLLADGWHLKLQTPDNDRDPFYILEVAVRFDNYPPKVVKVGAVTGNQVQLTADTVEILDSANLLRVDVELNPHSWTVNGRSGIKAYLTSLWAVVEESPLELKWTSELADWEPGTPIFGD